MKNNKPYKIFGSGSKSMLQGKPFVVSLSNHNGFPTLRQAQGERKT